MILKIEGPSPKINSEILEQVYLRAILNIESGHASMSDLSVF